MNKRIFVLQGKGNIGKSSTIKEIFNLLEKKYRGKINIKYSITHKNKKDIMIIAAINGRLVGIESEGDPYSALEHSLKEFDKANCDTIFCPARTRGMTVEWIHSYEPKYKVNFQKQVVVINNAGGQYRNNIAVAQKLIKMAGL